MMEGLEGFHDRDRENGVEGMSGMLNRWGFGF